MAHLIVIGTSHIAKESVIHIKKRIEKEQPDIVAVELDNQRLHALLNQKQSRISIFDIGKIGFKGYLFVLIGSYVQKKLGNMVGLMPGSDMLQAVICAKKNNMKVALIDQDIVITLRKFSQAFTWKERWRFFSDMIKGLFFPHREMKKFGLNTIDLSKVPPKQLIRRLTAQVKKRYPSVYRVLIHERNIVMINNLKKIMTQHPDAKIIAVVGAGHEEAIVRGFMG
jgi:pheromone shutdown-related protein TraB